jgi:hypothetical protein
VKRGVDEYWWWHLDNDRSLESTMKNGTISDFKVRGLTNLKSLSSSSLVNAG